MPIWKYIFSMLAMASYLGTPLMFVIPGGVVVVGVHHDDHE